MVHQGRSLDAGAAHARLTEPNSVLALVEDPAGTVLGHFDLGVALCLGSRRDWKGSADGYISDVGVRPADRGQGIAVGLLTWAITRFATDGLPTASLNVDADNLSGAIRLYPKAGMQPSPSATEWSKTLSRSGHANGS
jgi:ribosomal protein S18 acetylase RimI-like enzyme